METQLFRRLTTDTIPEDKKALSLQAANDVKAFKASGGKIQQIPPGISAVDNMDWGVTKGYVDKRKRGLKARQK